MQCGHNNASKPPLGNNAVLVIFAFETFFPADRLAETGLVLRDDLRCICVGVSVNMLGCAVFCFILFLACACVQFPFDCVALQVKHQPWCFRILAQMPNVRPPARLVVAARVQRVHLVIKHVAMSLAHKCDALDWNGLENICGKWAHFKEASRRPRFHQALLHATQKHEARFDLTHKTTCV